jgi:apolipoprotein D and lipocalin family protein
MRHYLFLAALVLTAACASRPANRVASTPLPVAAIETQPYLGLWHEAARLPNGFQRDCAHSTAEYALRQDGMLSVHNVCYRADGRTRDVMGRARRVDAEEGRLKVSFFGPFWADYWVLERAPDYSWSIVGEPSGRYLWVLTRAEHITPEDRAAFEARLRALGYDTSALFWSARSS